MITTNLTGNFGNHMWYYSICRIVAEKLGYTWGINPIPTHDYYNGKSQFYFMNVNYGEKLKVIGKNKHGLNLYEGINNEYYDKHKFHEYKDDKCLINMYDSNVFNIKDNTMIHLISQSEDYLIDRKKDVSDWFQIMDEYIDLYNKKLNELGIILDQNLCAINFRGGEYRNVKNLICRAEYWKDSIDYMLNINPKMKFIIITDDSDCARFYIGDYPCYHLDIGFDFYVINQSKYIILSNSSFGWWAGWLNKKANLILAPKYWAKHNISNGYWSLGDSYARGFNYLDREGEIFDYETCKKEALQFYEKNGLN